MELPRSQLPFSRPESTRGNVSNMDIDPGTRSFQQEVEHLTQNVRHVYRRPDLIGLDIFLKTAAKPTPDNGTRSQYEEEEDTDKFAVVHELRTGSTAPLGPSPTSLATFPDKDAIPKSTVLFLRGYATPEWLTELANEHSISADLYGRHLQYITSTLAGRDLHSSPSLPSSSARVFQLRIPTICFSDDGSISYEPEDLQRARGKESDAMNKYLLQLRSKANVADSIVRECHLLSKQERVLEQTATVEVGPPGDSWRAVVWLDCGLDLSRSVRGVEKPWDPPVTSLSWQTYFFPVIVHPTSGTYTPTLDSTAATSPRAASPPTGPEMTRLSNASVVGWKASQNVCLLPFQYGSRLDRDLASEDALYALSELFQFAASAEQQFLNFIHHRIERELSFIGFERGLSNHEVSLVNLRYIKGILKRHEQSLAETSNMLENRSSLDWPRVSSASTRAGKAEQTANLLLTDFKYLLQRAESLARECEQGMATLANTAVLEESRRTVDMGMRVERLTMIATVFIPLSQMSTVDFMDHEDYKAHI
ncbi:hypothetical protein DL767_001234 [Monosporascus sp. MG133]|nr:hypothetical protein DL767_001234 [Monosporascus sp. MG133]